MLLLKQSIAIEQINLARIRRMVKEGSWIVTGQIASVLGSLVLVRVLTERLDPTQYGQLALGLTVAGLVNQVVMGGVINGIGRYYSIAAEKHELHNYLYASRQLMVYATVVVVAIGLMITAGLFWLGYSQWLGLVAAALLFSMLSGYNSSLSGIQNAARQRAIVAFHGGLDAWLKTFLAMGVLFYMGNSSTAVVISYALSSLMVTGSQFLFLRRLIPHQSALVGDGNKWIRQMWTYSWPFSVWGIVTWAQLSSDRWALDMFASKEKVGLYAVLFQLGYTPISLATGMVVSFLGPIMYQRSGDATDYSRNTNVHRLAWRITLISLFFTLIACFFALYLHSWLFRMLVAPGYRAVSYLLPWIVLAGGLFAAGQVLALKLMSDMKSVSMMRAKIVTALLGVLLNIYGTSIGGLQGVVGALVVFSATYFVWMVFLASRIPEEP